jgi:DNA-binding GntR family transcriptional regulator
MVQPQRRTARLPLKPVIRGTLPGEIYRQIKDLILDGGIAPGELVTIQGLADAFGVSAMPVREALQRLTAEKALTVVSGRSVGIPELQAARLKDLCRVRIEIETMATVWAAGNLGAADIARLEGLVATMAQAVADGDPHQFVRANHEFHFTVYRASGSETLLAIIEGLWLQVSPYFHLLHGSGNYALANHEHEQMLAAVRRNDPQAAGRAIRADIEEATKVLLGLLD